MKMLLAGVLTLPLVFGDFANGQVSTNQSGLSTRMIDVDGRSIRVRTAGLERRTPRQPVVLFESGGSAPLETWDSILPAVAQFAPVIAYDRVGTGQSPWDSLPQTPERIVARLPALLAKLGASPPYVLVGHSWGGALIRYFAGTHPADVAGMVYIDPTDFTQSRADELAVFESIGSNAAARDSFYSIMERAMTNAPPALRSEGAVTMSIFKQDIAERRLPPVPAVPATILVAGRPVVLPQAGVPFDTKRFADASYQARLRSLRGWGKEPGRFIVATNSGHMIHVTEPQLVIDAIRALTQRY
jgi:pimeloyl-ACP methyl ester carboxylesterase